MAAARVRAKASYDELLKAHELLSGSYRQLLGDHEALQELYVNLEEDCAHLLRQVNKKSLVTLNHKFNSIKVLSFVVSFF